MPRKILRLVFAALAAYAISLIPTLYARVKMDRSFPALSRYVLEPTPEIVLVGSSMTYRLYEGYFQAPVRNLAIGGGSSLTGLAIIGSYDELPKTILVEVNVLSRPVDTALLSAFESNEQFKWLRAVVSNVYYWIKYQPEDVPRLLRSEPVHHDISAILSEAIRDYNSDNHDAEMRANIAPLKKLIRGLEQRGCRVLLFEMPSPAPLGESRFAVTARTLTKEALPDNRWINAPDEGGLTWLDAAHLDERSAAAVAREIDRRITARE